MKYCVASRPLRATNYVREETDACERGIKSSLEFLYPAAAFFDFFVSVYETRFEMSWVNLTTWRLCCWRGWEACQTTADRALCCSEKQREVPHANSKGNSEKRGSKKEDNVLSLIERLLWKMQDTRARDTLLRRGGPLLCHCVTLVRHHVDT